MSNSLPGGIKFPTVLLVGPSGIGKTTTIMQALNPETTYWICTERGALAPAYDKELNQWGKLPKFDECLSVQKPYEEVLTCLRKGIREFNSGNIKAIVLDTLSSVADREYMRIRNIEKVTDKYGAANRVLASRISQIVSEAMESGCIFLATCHERDATRIDDKMTPGGPKLAGDLVKSVPAQFDMVLRCRIGVSGEGKAEGIFEVNRLDPTYLTKDRYNVVKSGETMDLKSVLQRAVKKIMEWA